MLNWLAIFPLYGRSTPARPDWMQLSIYTWETLKAVRCTPDSLAGGGGARALTPHIASVPRAASITGAWGVSAPRPPPARPPPPSLRMVECWKLNDCVVYKLPIGTRCRMTFKLLSSESGQRITVNSFVTSYYNVVLEVSNDCKRWIYT